MYGAMLIISCVCLLRKPCSLFFHGNTVRKDSKYKGTSKYGLTLLYLYSFLYIAPCFQVGLLTDTASYDLTVSKIYVAIHRINLFVSKSEIN